MKEALEKILLEACLILKQKREIREDSNFPIQVKCSKNLNLGEYSSNLAFVLDGRDQNRTQDLAEKLIAYLPASTLVSKIVKDERGLLTWKYVINFVFDV